ncbi:MAG: PSD1 and planctomycete cytochrome C domain-containing protein [Lacipirellulaceae bacterium]
MTVRANDALEFFEKKVRPILAEHCYSCHSVNAEKLQAGLLVDSRASLLTGGDSGASIVPGNADESLLIEAVRYETYEMPPSGKLPESDIQTLEQWVNMGAPWPEEDAPTASALKPEFDLQKRRSEHWCWQPVRKPSGPEVEQQDWPRKEIDQFILSRLESEGLTPAVDAKRSALLRRLYFDLIGLPPTPEQAEKFLNDRSPQAVERLVDELLASPHFGERWGRHWLDLVRYAESRGHEFDHDAPNAFQYRDYIIRALNADVPYDQLVHEHIAGDLLGEPRLHPEKGFNESILGTGFWFLGEWVHSPVDIRKDETDRFDNMIDVMSKTFLGVTVSCARCHDHKFDAISSEDYYALSGFLQSSDYRQVRFESHEQNGKVAAKLEELDARYKSLIAKKLASAGLTLPVAEPLSGEAVETVVVDYSNLASEEYRQDDYIFGKQPRRLGDAYLADLEDRPAIQFAMSDAAVSDSFWNGLVSHSGKALSHLGRLVLPQSGRTLRTPTFRLTDGQITCRVKGSGHVFACVDSHRMINGPLHGETIKKISKGSRWVDLDLSRYVGHRLHLEFTPEKDSTLEVMLVIQGATQAVRQQLNAREEIIRRLMKRYSEAARQHLAKEAEEIAHIWAAERAKLQSQVMQRSHLAMTMADGTGEDDHLLIRGNSSKPGNLVPRRFLTAISGGQPLSIGTGSGRLELAKQITDPENPLTTRVIANRVWHYLMGRGIVPTTDDFGVLGQKPTHPELLDHLATKFVEQDQSIKQLIRYIVLSRTYQMSSHIQPDAVAADPKNLTWHHRPPKRLEGEVIRDALLAISGRLDTKQFGEPVPVHLTSFMGGRGRPKKSGPRDGAGRRSIYLAVRRNFLSPTMLAFDTPAPFSTMGRRNVSNVPAQALILMNNPLVVELSGQWAKRALRTHPTLEGRIDGMYQAAFARLPTEREQQIAREYLQSQAVEHDANLDSQEIWADFAHALVNTKEFIFLP